MPDVRIRRAHDAVAIRVALQLELARTRVAFEAGAPCTGGPESILGAFRHMWKKAGPEAAWVANQAVQLFGGMGYMTESEVERQYRDMRIIGIGGGTTEILTSLAAKTLGFQS